MRKTKITHNNPLKWIIFSLALWGGTGQLAAQTMVCNDNVQISVDPTPDGSCTVDLTADMVLEGPSPNTDYLIEVLQGPNVLFSGTNIVSFDASAYLNGTYITRVTDLNTNNKCWGSIHLEDKAGPVVNCNTVTISCTQDYNNVPYPDADDNCDPNPTVNLINQNVDANGQCSQGVVVVERTFKAIDASGNDSQPCVQVITIERPNYVDFPNDIMWECTQYDDYPGIIAATPLHPSVLALQVGTQLIDATVITSGSVLSNTGSGIPDGVDGQFCNYAYSNSDQTVADCGTTFKIIRTWTVIDWCTGSVITSNPQGEDNIQIVKIVDSTPPVVTMQPFTVSANVPGVHPNPCTSQGLLPGPNVSDNCNDWTIRIFTPVGEATYINGVDGANGGLIPAPGLSLGFHQINYQVTDDCGNQTELWVTIEVVDDVAPTAICDEITDVSLSSNGMAIVNASVFDDGSYDNCCLDEFLARRMDGDCDGNYDDFGPTVKFCCTDVDDNPIMIVFRVTDCYGNYNDCMVEVEVEDKLPPVVNCPADETIDCDYYLDGLDAAIQAGDYSVLDQFGSPTFFDNCEAIPTETVSVNVNSCTEGTIIRTWEVNDPSGNTPSSCSQTIFIDHVSDWVVEFPDDIDAVCLDGELPEFGEPEIFNDECEMVGTSFSDQYFYIVPDACYKIIRTWTVVNWCIYDEYGYDAFPEDGFAECDLFVDWDGDGDQDCLTFRDGWNSSGTPGTPDGYIVFEQTIKVVDNDPPVFTIPEIDGCIVDTDCDTDIIIPYPDVEDLCSPTFEVDITGDFGIFNDISGDITIPDVAPGTYTIYYSVSDNCGNTAYDDVTIVVEDCKLPTPYCKSGLIVEIMQTGEIDIWANDFNDGSFDNCPGILTFSFSPDPTDDVIIFTCDDLGQTMLEMWVTDAAGNQDFCVTNVLVQDNMGVCDPGGNGGMMMIAGLIENEAYLGLDNVMVEINGTNNQAESAFTDVNGAFEFEEIELGYDYSVTPMLNSDPAQGVTTYDLVYIMMHILNIDLLDSPYKIIAADANNSGTVTTADMVDIRRVILQLQPGFTNNTSWRFVPVGYDFPNPQNPFVPEFPEVINVNDLDADILDADFMAIKIGDVNLSAIPGITNGDLQEFGAKEPLILNFNDQDIEAGDLVEVAFRPSLEDLDGVQFTFEFDPQVLEFVEIGSGLAQQENFGLAFLDKGVITASWNGELTTDLPLFSFTFHAKEAGTLSELLNVNSRYTPAEAYSAGAQVEVQLGTADGVLGTALTLYQNEPNPFTNQTIVGFYLPEADDIRLQVTDISGKILKVVAGNYDSGYHQIVIEAAELEGSGVMYYTLSTENDVITQKMILIR